MLTYPLGNQPQDGADQFTNSDDDKIHCVTSEQDIKLTETVTKQQLQKHMCEWRMNHCLYAKKFR